MAEVQRRLAFALMRGLFLVRDRIWPPERTLREIGVQPGQGVLDFGCGPGGYSIAAARIVGTAGRVYALDINPLAVNAVQRAASKHALPNITPILGDGPSSLIGRDLDVAIMHDVLHELDNPPAVLLGIAGVLKPQGILAVSDHHLNGPAIAAAVTSSGVFSLDRHFRGVYCFTRRTRE